MSKKPATYADLEALPRHVVGELIAGELYVSPRPAIPHAIAAHVLASELYGPFQRGLGGPGGWLILFEPELHFGEDALVPDLAGWLRERVPAEALKAAAMTLAPDWLCEVLSPSTARLDRARKLDVYAREGVRHVWLLDPLARALEVFRLEEGRYSLLGTYTGEATVRAEPFEALGLQLRVLWEG
jgi:Uma2 family endonuclease